MHTCPSPYVNVVIYDEIIGEEGGGGGSDIFAIYFVQDCKSCPRGWLSENQKTLSQIL